LKKSKADSGTFNSLQTASECVKKWQVPFGLHGFGLEHSINVIVAMKDFFD